jgi:hypothetical protein
MSSMKQEADKWVVEASELKGMARSDVERLQAYLFLAKAAEVESLGEVIRSEDVLDKS